MATPDRRLADAQARLQALKADHEAGRLDDARYADQRRTVEHEIGELLTHAAVSTSPVRPSAGLVAVLAVVVLAVAGLGYWKTGSPSLARLGPSSGADATTAAAPADPAASAAGLKQIEAMVGQLAERMKENPNDAQGWAMLARSYTVLSRFADALPAYRRASELQPPNAALLADWADAVAATQGRADNPESVSLVARALALDPKHVKGLALAGTIAYERGDFKGASAQWQKIVDQLPPGSEIAQQIQASIDEAHARSGAPPAKVAAAPPAPGSTEAKPGIAGGAVSGIVTLDPALRAKASADDSVFVFARPASGGRMPLAVLRAKVSDLPLTFRLDDSMAMAPGMTISSVPLVTVGARISKTGNAIAQAGDLAGESATAIAPGTSGIAITIGSVVGAR
ncbi:MAG: c-type cytochrome biogenesis protein CcmI [Caldimonas sp.]